MTDTLNLDTLDAGSIVETNGDVAVLTSPFDRTTFDQVYANGKFVNRPFATNVFADEVVAVLKRVEKPEPELPEGVTADDDYKGIESAYRITPYSSVLGNLWVGHGGRGHVIYDTSGSPVVGRLTVEQLEFLTDLAKGEIE